MKFVKIQIFENSSNLYIYFQHKLGLPKIHLFTNKDC